MFTKGFSNYACEGDSITCEVEGFTATARIYRDDCGDAPFERDDGFWPSLDRNSAGFIGPKSQRTLERHHAKAVAVLKAWRNDEWFYCGVAVTLEDCNGVAVTAEFDHALWGIECNYPARRARNGNVYLLETARELLQDALQEVRA